MNVLELKQQMKQLDNNKNFFKILGLALLLSAITFPINYWINPNMNPIVHDSPILLGLGFFAFIVMFLTFIVGSLIITMVILESYLFVSPKFLSAYDRFNANSILRVDHVPREIAKGVHRHYLELSKHDNDPRFEELEVKFERQHNDHMENERFYINHNLRIIRKLEDERKKNIELQKLLKNTIPLEEYERITTRLLKIEEELKKIKSD